MFSPVTRVRSFRSAGVQEYAYGTLREQELQELQKKTG
ncbi:hypothetical protein B6N60_04510 [Richelia sinica FACHB-800]|uniref:Uncharacterized protein n=1 Tax=Richelia sinica FACHB-800 TaxID=1357546 RepID=A0A975TC83_9NOST|nr:hypothetical protein B6N60_04510 [Richelia sinica FACHB-800]